MSVLKVLKRIIIETLFFVQFFQFLGDKEHHEPVYHLTMPLHACFIYALIMAPYSFIVPAIALISGLFENSSDGSRPLNNVDVSQGSKGNGDLQIKKIGNDNVIVSMQRCNVSRTSSDQNLSKHRGELLCIILKHSIGLMIVTYVLQHYTLSHPFLLADNRCVIMTKHYFTLLTASHFYSFIRYFFPSTGTTLFIFGLGFSANPT